MPRSTPADPTLAYLLSTSVRLLRADFRERSVGLKLTPELAKLLFYIHRDPGSSQTELAARLEVTAVTLGRMIDRLAERRYVRRVADPNDRRAFRLHVDRAGKPLIGRMEKMRIQAEKRATRGMSTAERAGLVKTLERICRNLSDRTS
jgi:MarR family transcriptional regulator, transcriptional regulator for hemolysin